MSEITTHKGSCHCGAVDFEVDVALDGLIECNCSHCYRKGLVLTFVSPDAFRQTAGEAAETDYRFNTHAIGHQFCATCGVETFARGVGPDGSEMVAINIRSLTDVGPFAWTAQRVDGRKF